MKLGPRYKICRRLGAGVFEKCQTQRFVASESKKTTKGGRGGKALSDFGKQLLEKQKVRFTYGLNERQLRRYIAESQRRSHIGIDPISAMIGELESRLDNIIYRSGLASTRRQARQMVSHGHITVGGRKVTIPSYTMKADETFGVRNGSDTKALFAIRKEDIQDASVPVWLSFDSTKMEGRKVSEPTPDNTEMSASLSAVIEFYSR